LTRFLQLMPAIHWQLTRFLQLMPSIHSTTTPSTLLRRQPEGPLTRPARVTRPGPAISQGTGGATGPNPAPLNTPALAVTRLCPSPRRGPNGTPPAQGRGCAARTTRIVNPRQKMKELDEALAKKLNSICRLGGYDIARH